MKDFTTRELTAQSIIVLGSCLGVSLLVLQPMKARLSAENHQLASNQSLVAQHHRTSTARDDARHTSYFTAISSRIETLARPAHTAASLHDALMRIAAETGVRIEAVEPRHIAIPEPPPAAALPDPAAPPSNALPINILSASINGSGSYEAVSSFLTRLDEMGLTRLLTAQIAPSTGKDGTPVARFTLTSAHFAFAIPADTTRTSIPGGDS